VASVPSLEDLGEVAGRRVLVRTDFNVPMSGPDDARVVTDDFRIRAALPTIEYLTSRGAQVVCASHLGRPKGQANPKYSMAPVRRILAELAPGVELLENLRFHPGEEGNDPAFVDQLIQGIDLYVNDAFGAAHRAHASVTDVARLLPNAAGRLVHQEASVFGRIMADPARPFVVVLGGSKVSDKLGVIGSLISRVDRLLIGGGMAYTFLAAQGHGVGDSLLEADQIETVRGFLEQAQARGVEVLLPVDFVIADRFAADADTRVVDADSLPDGWMGLDIGPRTRELFATRIADAGTVVWNGPMGVFEMEAFSGGTLAVARAMAASDAMTVIGGGDSAAAVRILDVDESRFTHISTGGGASLEFLEGKTLPGLAVLEETA